MNSRREEEASLFTEEMAMQSFNTLRLGTHIYRGSWDTYLKLTRHLGLEVNGSTTSSEAVAGMLLLGYVDTVGRLAHKMNGLRGLEIQDELDKIFEVFEGETPSQTVARLLGRAIHFSEIVNADNL